MNKTIFKYFFLLLILLLICCSFSGCSKVQSIDDLAYAVAMGIDVGDNNNIKFTLQFTMPNNSGEGGSGEPAPSIVESVECSSIDSGINLLNSYVSKEINLSHCKVIIFSEKIAEKGISKEVYTLINKVQIRPDANIIVSRSDAKDFIEASNPSLENLVAKYYEIAPRSSEYTGYTANVTIGEFFNALTDSYCEPFAILGGINTDSTHNNKSSSNSEKDSTNKANETPFEVTSPAESNGLAVFHSDKLVGELSSIDCICHLIVTNKLKNCTISIPNPFIENDSIDLYLYQQSSTKTKVNLVNGSPYAKFNVSLNARILSIDENADYLTEDKLDKIIESANNYLKQHISEYLYKTSKEFNSDIAGIGKHLASQFLTIQDWENYNWLENYKNTFFSVDVNTNIKSSHLLSET